MKGYHLAPWRPCLGRFLVLASSSSSSSSTSSSSSSSASSSSWRSSSDASLALAACRALARSKLNRWLVCTRLVWLSAQRCETKEQPRTSNRCVLPAKVAQRTLGWRGSEPHRPSPHGVASKPAYPSGLKFSLAGDCAHTHGESFTANVGDRGIGNGRWPQGHRRCQVPADRAESLSIAKLSTVSCDGSVGLLGSDLFIGRAIKTIVRCGGWYGWNASIGEALAQLPELFSCLCCLSFGKPGTALCR